MSATSLNRHKKSMACKQQPSKSNSVDNKIEYIERIEIETNGNSQTLTKTMGNRKSCIYCGKVMHICSLNRHLKTQACKSLTNQRAEGLLDCNATAANVDIVEIEEYRKEKS